MSRVRSLPLVSLLVLVAGCPPPPGPIYGALTIMSRDTIVTQARTMTYDTTHGQSDNRRLMTIGWFHVRGYGTQAWIQPLDSSYLLDTMQLKAGHVVARILTLGDGDYGKFHLPSNDTVYLYIKDTLALFIPTNPGRPVGQARNTFHRYTGVTWGAAFAKWVFDWNDDYVWVTCAIMGCCYIDET